MYPIRIPGAIKALDQQPTKNRYEGSAHGTKN